MIPIFEVYRPNGSVAVNGSNRGVIFIGTYTIPANSASGSVSFPQAPAGAIFIFNLDGGSHDFDTVSPAGAPSGRINWTQRAGQSGATTLMVFSRRMNTPDLYTLTLLNESGETLVDLSSPVPQYGGSVQPAANASTSYMTPGGLQANVHNVSTNIRPGRNRIVLMQMPDSGAADIWYSYDSFIPASSTTAAVLSLTVYAPPGASYQVPSLHVYSLDGPVSSGAGFGYDFQIFLPDASLVYDALAENLTIADSVAVTYPAPGQTSTYGLNLPANPGIAIPYFYRHDFGANNTASIYVAAARRVGSQVTFKAMHTSTITESANGLTSYQYGASANGFCLAVDLAQLGGTSVTGIPASTTQSPAAITAQPSNQSVTAGEAATFTVGVTGTPAPVCQWQENNANIQGATSPTYSFTAALGQNGHSFRCVVSNTTATGLHLVNSNTVTLAVAAGGDGSLPQITTHPSNITVAAGGVASFSCSASGSGVSYTWFRNNLQVGTGSTYSFVADSSTAGAYYCVASNANGSATSNSAVLTIADEAVPAPVISLQPVSVTTPYGFATSFSCEASPVTSQTWYRDGAYAGMGSTHSPDVSTSGTFSYFCVCENGSSSTTSSTVTLTVTGAATNTFQSYNDVNAGTVEAFDEPAAWGISESGSTTGGNPWANGPGDGGLYRHTATSDTFAPAAGSASLNVAYTSAEWRQELPGTFVPGTFLAATLTITTRIASTGQEVCHHTVTLKSTRS